MGNAASAKNRIDRCGAGRVSLTEQDVADPDGRKGFMSDEKLRNARSTLDNSL